MSRRNGQQRSAPNAVDGSANGAAQTPLALVMPEATAIDTRESRNRVPPEGESGRR